MRCAFFSLSAVALRDPFGYGLRPSLRVTKRNVNAVGENFANRIFTTCKIIKI